MRQPKDNEPLALWLKRVFDDVGASLTTDEVRRSLGNEAEHAFAFDGVDFLADVLTLRADSGRESRAWVVDGVTELVANIGCDPADRRYGLQERAAALTYLDRSPRSLSQAVEAATHFNLLARASLEQANFGGRERAADIALFETFRLASIAVLTNGTISLDESALLLHIMSWHGGTADDEEEVDLPAAFATGVAMVDLQSQTFDHHSLVLRITSSTTTVADRLQACALTLIDTTLRLDGVDDGEADSLAAPAVEPAGLAADLELVAGSIFIIPRGRGGRLKPDSEFDKLWALYRQAVPWSTPDRKTKR